MKTYKFLFVITLFFSLLLSCQEQDYEVIISDLDGEEYYSDMSGEMNTRKAARLIIENKIDKVPLDFQLLISDSLNSKEIYWQKIYLKAFSLIIVNFSENQKSDAAPKLFSFFMHHPKMYKEQIIDMDIENSDYFLELISLEINQHIQEQKITINSIINLAIKYCDDCNEATIEFLINYIELAEKLVLE